VKKEVSFGIVGVGGVGQTYAQAFEGCDFVQLSAVADTRAEVVFGSAQKLSCQAYDSYEAMAKHAKLDAVIVCTPPVTHPEICVYFLERGIHVLCEKPFSIESESARRMLRVADETGSTLTMGSKFRYAEDVIRAKQIVASGILGDIILFENTFASRVNMSSRWNSNPAISGGGVLIDNGSHSVDLMRYFLGPLADVQVIEGKRAQGLSVEDTVRIFVRSAAGVTGSIDLSWSINKELDNYLSIYGSHGTVLVGWKESKYRQSSSSEWVVFGHGYSKLQAFRRQISNFARSILKQEQLLITADDGLASVRAIEAAYSSLHRQNWTSVRDEYGPTLASDPESVRVA
jgi:predicted dehydrogenase